MFISLFIIFLVPLFASGEYCYETRVCQEDGAADFKEEMTVRVNRAISNSCLSIRRRFLGQRIPDGVYQIFPFGNATGVDVFCDMNTDRGIYNSCATALKANGNQNGLYRIQVAQNTAQIEVTCERRDQDAVAIIDHNTENRAFVEGYEGSGSYNKQIHYAMLASVEALIDSSFSCRQFIKIECFHMMLKGRGWLEGRGRKNLSIWGGDPKSGTGPGCACGLNNSCHITSAKCNCDANIGKWLIDEGYITVKSDLPVTGIRLGDTGNKQYYEKAYHTIGKLECVQH